MRRKWARKPEFSIFHSKGREIGRPDFDPEDGARHV
jgi:hypothetical protein